MSIAKLGSVIAVGLEPHIVLTIENDVVTRTMPVRDYWLESLRDPNDPKRTLKDAQPPYTQNEKFLQGMCGYKENLVVCILTAGHVERSKTPHTDAEGCPMGDNVIDTTIIDGLRAENKALDLKWSAASSFIRDVIEALGQQQPPTEGIVNLEELALCVVGQIEELKVAVEKEPMNLRLFQDGITWFIRGFGYSGNGLTPGLALRDLARHLNSVEKEQWPVEGEPLLSCVDCKNTESCAGAMARAFNHGRCLHCGGYFKVVRA